MTDKLQIPFIFKGSYRKANRSRLDSFTGIGDETALRILQKVGREIGVPTVTDIHESERPPWRPSTWMCCRFQLSCAGKPTCSSPPPKPAKWSTSRKASF